MSSRCEARTRPFEGDKELEMEGGWQTSLRTPTTYYVQSCICKLHVSVPFVLKGLRGTGSRQSGPCPAAAHNHFRVQHVSQPAAAPC